MGLIAITPKMRPPDPIVIHSMFSRMTLGDKQRYLSSLGEASTEKLLQGNGNGGNNHGMRGERAQVPPPTRRPPGFSNNSGPNRPGSDFRSREFDDLFQPAEARPTPRVVNDAVLPNPVSNQHLRQRPDPPPPGIHARNTLNTGISGGPSCEPVSRLSQASGTQLRNHPPDSSIREAPVTSVPEDAAREGPQQIPLYPLFSQRPKSAPPMPTGAQNPALDRPARPTREPVPPHGSPPPPRGGASPPGRHPSQATTGQADQAQARAGQVIRGQGGTNQARAGPGGVGASGPGQAIPGTRQGGERPADSVARNVLASDAAAPVARNAALAGLPRAKNSKDLVFLDNQGAMDGFVGQLSQAESVAFGVLLKDSASAEVFSTLRDLSSSQMRIVRKKRKELYGDSPADDDSATLPANTLVPDLIGVGFVILGQTPPDHSHDPAAPLDNATSLPQARSAEGPSARPNGPPLYLLPLGDFGVSVIPERRAAQGAARDRALRLLASFLRSPHVRKACFNLQATLVQLMAAGVAEATVVAACRMPDHLRDPRIMAWLVEPELPSYDLPALLAWAGVQGGPGGPASQPEACTGLPPSTQAALSLASTPEAPLVNPVDLFRCDLEASARLGGSLGRRLGLDEAAPEGACRAAGAMSTEVQLAALLARLELTGTPVDETYMSHKGQALQGRMETLVAQSHACVGHEFNLASPLQLSKVLFEELGLKPPPAVAGVSRKAATTHATTNETALQQLVGVHPLPALVLEYRNIAKLKSTWVDALVGHTRRDRAGQARVHSRWHAQNTATGRLSSSDPNLQCVPKFVLEGRPSGRPTLDGGDFFDDEEPREGEGSGAGARLEGDAIRISIRDAFVARKGHVLLCADYSQIELRVLAHLSGDAKLIGMLEKAGPDGDVFLLIATQWLHKPTGAVTPEERQAAKRVCYGVLYGQGKAALASFLKVPVLQAQRLLDSFLNFFPQMRQFLQRVKAICRQQNGMITMRSGRYRMLPDINSNDPEKRAKAERQAVNSLIQGSAADIVKEAMLRWSRVEVPPMSCVEVPPMSRVEVPPSLGGEEEEGGMGRAGGGLEEPMSPGPEFVPSELQGKARLLMQIHDELVFEVDERHVAAVERLVRACMTDVARDMRVPLPVSISQLHPAYIHVMGHLEHFSILHDWRPGKHSGLHQFHEGRPLSEGFQGAFISTFQFGFGRPLMDDPPSKQPCVADGSVYAHSSAGSAPPTLHDVVGVPGLGARIMAGVPLPDRVRLRGLCRAFAYAVDASLQDVRRIDEEDLGPLDRWGRSDGDVLRWLAGKCPKLRVLAAAETFEEPPDLPWWHLPVANAVITHVATQCRQLHKVVLYHCEGVGDPALLALGANCSELVDVDVCNCPLVTDAGVSAIAAGCRQLAVLTVRDNPNVTDDSLLALGAHCPRLEYLDVHASRVGNAGLIAISRGCRDLKLLDVMGCAAVDDEGVIAVAESCPRLEILDYRLTNVSDRGIATVVSHCEHLQDLYLEYYHSVEALRLGPDSCRKLRCLTISFSMHITDEVLVSVVTRGSPLTWVHLVKLSITDDSMKALAANCPLLEKLEIRWCDQVTDVGILAVASNCPRLLKVDVEKCHRVTDASLVELVQRCPDLKELSLAGSRAGNATMLAAARHCPNLCVLHVSTQPAGQAHVGQVSRRDWREVQLRDDGLEAVLRNCLQLKTLGLMDCQGLTDAGIRMVGDSCKSLRELRLQVSRDCFTARGLAAMAPHLGALERLNASGSDAVTDVSLLALASHCRWLKVVDVSQCRVGDQGVIALVGRNRRLTTLNVGHSGPGLTDAGLMAISDACTQLRELDISGCAGVTTAGIMAVATKCKTLRVLDIRGCLLSARDLRALNRVCPHVDSWEGPLD
eukprot:jgi/Mesvir1/16553/Mv10094-RA.1